MLHGSIFLHNTAFPTPTRKKQPVETVPSSTVRVMTLLSLVRARSTAPEVLALSCLWDFKSAPGYSGENAVQSLFMGPKRSGKSALGPSANLFDCLVKVLIDF